MTEFDQPETTPQPEPLVMFVTHNDNGIPTVVNDPQLGIDKLMIPYIQTLFGEQEFIQEHTESGALTIILDSNGRPRYTLLGSNCTREELTDWVKRCGGFIEGKPWQFKMGHGATIPQVGHFINNPSHEAFNPIVDFLNDESGLSGWAGGLSSLGSTE